MKNFDSENWISGMRKKRFSPENGVNRKNFLQQLEAVVHKNLDDENFGIDEICAALNTSRATLYRKLKAKTGESVSLYIRSVRLKKAKELLQGELDFNISQIAFEVGFKDLAYFSAMFKKEFGVSPKEIRK